MVITVGLPAGKAKGGVLGRVRAGSVRKEAGVLYVIRTA